MAKKQLTIEEQMAEAKRIEELGSQGIDPSVEAHEKAQTPQETAPPEVVEPETTVVTQPEKPAEVPAVIDEETSQEHKSMDVIVGNIFDSGTAFNHIQRVAKVFALSSLVPAQYRGSLPNCIIGIQMARRMGIDEFMFLQKSYVVQGRCGIEGQIAIALINKRAPITDYLHFDYSGEGDNRKCTAWVTHKKGGKLEFSMTIKEAKDWGWYGKSGSAWPKQPDQMLAYRTAMFLARRYFPDVLMGLDLSDELREMESDGSLETKITAITSTDVK